MTDDFDSVKGVNIGLLTGMLCQIMQVSDVYFDIMEP